MKESGRSYEWIILRPTNIGYVANVTGHSKADLKHMLEVAARDGRYEVRVPYGTKLFTRDER